MSGAGGGGPASLPAEGSQDPSFVQVDAGKRQRTGGAGFQPQSMAKKHGKKKAYRKTGQQVTRRGGSLRAGSFASRVTRPLVHRNIFGRNNNWGQDAGGLLPIHTEVPERTWGQYTRGFDLPQVQSNGIFSRNVSMNLRIQFPKAGVAAQPYQLRVVQCWIKSTMNEVLHSTAGTSGMFDGIVLNFDPNTAWEQRAHQVMIDSTGVVNGDGNPTGNINADRVKVISDRKYVIDPSVTAAAGTYVFPSFQRTYNFKTQQAMRLYASTDGAAIPADPLNIKLVPVNNATLWIPCVCSMILNGGDYTGLADVPVVFMTESHYWTDR